MPDYKQYLSLDYWRAHQLEVSYGIAAFILFLGFLFATFPYAPALKGAMSSIGLRFNSSEQSFAFPFGVRLDNVSIRSTTPGTPPLFESASVRVWPALGSLMLLRPGISASAQAYSGMLYVQVHRKGDQAIVGFEADKIDLASVHLLRQIGAALGGELSGDGEISVDPASPADNDGTARLHAKGFMIRIPGPMPPLGLGEVDLKVHLNPGELLIQQLKSSGGDIAIDGAGSIHIDQYDWHESKLALQFTLTPTPTARQRLGFLLNFLPHPPGTGPYKLGGTISSPALS